jgi:hypothetical protein
VSVYKAKVKLLRRRFGDPSDWMYRGWVVNEDGYSWNCRHRHMNYADAQACADRELNRMVSK